MDAMPIYREPIVSYSSPEICGDCWRQMLGKPQL